MFCINESLNGNDNIPITSPTLSLKIEVINLQPVLLLHFIQIELPQLLCTTPCLQHPDSPSIPHQVGQIGKEGNQSHLKKKNYSKLGIQSYYSVPSSSNV